MPQDLRVEENSEITVSDEPGPALDDYIERVRIDKFGDLVESELIREDALNTMLEAGKAVTVEAMRNVSRIRPIPFVPGTKRLDLGRYTAFAAETTTTLPSERSLFWNYFRAIDPAQVVAVNVDTVLPAWRSRQLIKLVARDCTIEQGATLRFVGNNKALVCNDLIIRRTGRIVVRGGLHIRAASIAGEQ